MLTSLIRTWTPILAGWAVTWLVSFGVELNEPEAVAVVAGVISAIYYAVARQLEARWPAAGWLLGRPTPPTY